MATGAEARVDVRLLGGVDVLVADRRAELGGSKPRAVLALLAMSPGNTVTADQLVDGVWGETAPQSVRSSLQVHLSNLRRALAAVGADGLIETRPGGYSFAADASIVDLHRFDTKRAAAREAFGRGDLSTAARAAREARGQWRGPPFAGLGDAPWVAPRATVVEGDYIALVELHADIQVAYGHPGAAVPDLEQLVADYPYRESAWQRLAIALYRGGRQVDALDRLRAVRRVLADELGLDPSPDLAALEGAILRQDPALLGHTGAVARPTLEPAMAASRLPPERALVERGELIDQLVAALAENPLVTIVGPGGVGKTALAVAAASRAAHEPGVAARFVDLTAIERHASVIDEIAGAYGIQPSESVVREHAVIDVLAALAAPILVLDNCEHVIDGVRPVVTRLVEAIPRLRVLATSRRPLGVAGERVVACGPLSVDAGVELFVARAAAADREYVADAGELVAIRTLVAHVDGLPLAIELFAARAAALSAVDMVTRLDGATMLTITAQGAAPRHRSLGDVVAWSFDLLDATEQTCLRQLAVFGGGADLAAVAAVCGQARVTTVADLVDRSLVVAERTPAGLRYRLLATVRAFLRELPDVGDLDAARQRLVEHTIGWARAVADRLAGPDPAGALAELEANAANVRAAYDAASDADRIGLVAAFGTWALMETAALPEAAGWLDSAVRTCADDDPRRGWLAIALGRFLPRGSERQLALALEALDAGERLGDAALQATALVSYASCLRDVDLERAAEVARRGAELAQQAALPLVAAEAVAVLCNALPELGGSTEAVGWFDRLTVAGTRRFGFFEPHLLNYRGCVESLGTYDVDAAERWGLAALDAADRIGSVSGRALALGALGVVASHRGDQRAAYDLTARSLSLTMLVDPGSVSFDHRGLAVIAVELGDLAAAERHVEALLRGRERAAMGDSSATVELNVALAEGVLATAKGHREFALDRLVEAARLALQVRHPEVASRIIAKRLTAVLPEGADPQRWLTVADDLRAGRIPIEEVTAMLDTVTR